MYIENNKYVLILLRIMGKLENLIRAMNPRPNQGEIVEKSRVAINQFTEILFYALLAIDAALVTSILINAWLIHYNLLYATIVSSIFFVVVTTIFVLSLWEINNNMRRMCKILMQKGWAVCGDISEFKNKKMKAISLITAFLMAAWYYAFSSSGIINLLISALIFLLYWAMLGIVIVKVAEWEGLTFHRYLKTSFEDVDKILKNFAFKNLRLLRNWRNLRIYRIKMNGKSIRILLIKARYVPEGMIKVSLTGVNERNVNYASRLARILERGEGDLNPRGQ